MPWWPWSRPERRRADDLTIGIVNVKLDNHIANTDRMRVENTEAHRAMADRLDKQDEIRERYHRETHIQLRETHVRLGRVEKVYALGVAIIAVMTVIGWHR